MYLGLDGGSGGSSWSGGSTPPAVPVLLYFDVNWSYTPVSPQSDHLTGFEVRIYEGTDPEDTTKQFFDPQIVPPGDRRLVIKGFFTASHTAYASVRAVYGEQNSGVASVTPYG